MRRALKIAVVLAVAMSAFSQNDARADYFSFGIGSGGGHHHHHGYYGGYWGPSYDYYYAPPPRYVYVAPPPVIQQPIYVQPQVIQQQPAISSYSSNANVNIAPAPRLPAPPTRAVAMGSPVVIRNTAGKGVPVSFLVDERSEELSEGQSRTFSGSSHVVEFDRGGDLGTGRYELTGGVYAFAVTDRGWELVRESNGSVSARTADRPALRRNEIPNDVKSR